MTESDDQTFLIIIIVTQTIVILILIIALLATCIRLIKKSKAEKENIEPPPEPVKATPLRRNSEELDMKEKEKEEVVVEASMDFGVEQSEDMPELNETGQNEKVITSELRQSEKQ